MSETLDLTLDLIARNSVTPADAGCQAAMCERLAAAGFAIESLRYGSVDNFWAKRGGTGPVLCFAGHTDVVPTGPLEEWKTDPFKPVVRDGVLYGRGAADMKSGLAAMVTATTQFVRETPKHRGSIAFLITSDEEGPAIDGTRRVVEWLKTEGEQIDYTIVGEPSSTLVFGDTIRNGRRGTLSGRVVIKGVQGHIAYPHLAKNPIHLAAPALAELAATEWDRGNEYFPPTSFQISNINGGTGAFNIIPGTLEVYFNFRFATASTEASLRQRTEAILDRHGLDIDITWTLGGKPFLTPRGKLVDALSAAVHMVTGITPELSTAGGTSDGRFIADICGQVAEFGPINATIHKIDEHVAIADISRLHEIYFRALQNLLLND